jgi:predicted nicotinamide N-methyase
VPKYDETLRWPTNLDRAAIEVRLVQVRDAAAVAGLSEVAALLNNPQKMTGAQIGAAVVAALERVQEKNEHGAITTQLEMVAMNLKNLK